MKKALLFLFLCQIFAYPALCYDFNIYKTTGFRYSETFGYAPNAGGGQNLYGLDQEEDYFFNRNLDVGIGFGLWVQMQPDWTEDFSETVKIPIYAAASLYLLPGAVSPFASIQAGELCGFFFSGRPYPMIVPAAGVKISIQSHFEVLLEIKYPLIEGRPGFIMPSIGVLI